MDNRAPKNMQELLKFAIKQQHNEGNEPVQIDEDKKVFLEQVLQSMSVNVMEEFLKAVHVLQLESSSDEEKLDALDLIRDYIDNIDFANSFAKIEGADILIKCFKDTNKAVSISAINIVAEMSQNNPFCQQFFLKYGIIDQLISFLSNENFELVATALYALSGLIRNYEPALMEFLKKDGIKHVNNCLSIESTRAFSKTCFLITSISSEFALVKDEFAKLGAINKLIKKLRLVNGYEADIEMVLKTMSVLFESRYCKLNEYENIHVTDILKTIVTKNKNLPECEEIVSYSNSILKDLEKTNVLNNQKS